MDEIETPAQPPRRSRMDGPLGYVASAAAWLVIVAVLLVLAFSLRHIVSDFFHDPPLGCNDIAGAIENPDGSWSCQ